MLKLMHKKRNKKGFTLAELLVVIAILAILIAIAVPVFTHMVAEANLRVNQANVHSVRSAAVAHILTHLGEDDDGTGTAKTKLNKYMAEPNHFWVAVAAVDNNGNISDLKVYALENKTDTNLAKYSSEGISTEASTFKTRKIFSTNKTDSPNFYPISDNVKDPFATLKPSMGDPKPGDDDGAKVYYVQAIITDLNKS